MRWSLFCNNRPAILWKKRLRHSCFPLNYAKCLKAPFLQNTSGRLLLGIAIIYQRGFKTKCEKNESNDILITYLYILLASTCNTSIHQTTSACKNKAKPYQFIPNHKAKIITFSLWPRGAFLNMFEVKYLVHLKVWG